MLTLFLCHARHCWLLINWQSASSFAMCMRYFVMFECICSLRCVQFSALCSDAVCCTQIGPTDRTDRLNSPGAPEFEMRQDFRRGTPANLTIFCIPHCWICSLISVDFVRELSHFRAIALTSYTLYGTLIRYWRTKIRRRASDVHLHLSLLGYYSGTGKMRIAECGKSRTRV